jgi:hypothetical protein
VLSLFDVGSTGPLVLVGILAILFSLLVVGILAIAVLTIFLAGAVTGAFLATTAFALRGVRRISAEDRDGPD